MTTSKLIRLAQLKADQYQRPHFVLPLEQCCTIRTWVPDGIAMSDYICVNPSKVK
jgi:hypothetical protein